MTLERFSWGRFALHAAAGLVLAASALSGVPRLAREIRVAFRDAGLSVFPTEFQRQRAVVEKTAPPGAVFLHISDWASDPGTGWYSRLWQRALYPRNLVIVVMRDLQPERLQLLRRRFGARYAISVGSPPIDPGFLWHRDLGVVPGSGQTWFGELPH
jgi:hypothetical protein